MRENYNENVRDGGGMAKLSGSFFFVGGKNIRVFFFIYRLISF